MNRKLDTRDGMFTGEWISQQINEVMRESVNAGDTSWCLEYWDPFEGWVKIEGRLVKVDRQDN